MNHGLARDQDQRTMKNTQSCGEKLSFFFVRTRLSTVEIQNIFVQSKTEFNFKKNIS